MIKNLIIQVKSNKNIFCIKDAFLFDEIEYNKIQLNTYGGTYDIKFEIL